MFWQWVLLVVGVLWVAAVCWWASQNPPAESDVEITGVHVGTEEEDK
jgi:hypothetical protein